MGLKNAVSKRKYKERSQPISREKFGLLEKKKDYITRARVFNKKQKTLKTLQIKAATKNPDEFYFAMSNTSTKNGVHVSNNRLTAFTHDHLKLLKTQDINYINYSKSVNKQKLDKIKNSLHFSLDTSENEANHTIFLDSAKEFKYFDPAAHFNTSDPSRKFNRPKNGQFVPNETELSKQREALQREFDSRLERENALSVVVDEMNLQKNLMTKGAKKVVGVDSRGLNIYKWRQERKK